MIKKLTFPLKLLITLGLLYWVGHRIMAEMGQSPQMEQLLDGRYSLQWNWLVVAGSVLLISLIGSAIQWWWLVRLMGGSLELLQGLRLYFIGLFFNIFWSVGGDLKKVIDLKKTGGSWAVGFSSTAFDRIFGLFVINFFCMVVGVLYFTETPKLNSLLLPSVGLSIAMVMFFCAMFSKHLMKYLQRLLVSIKLKKVGEFLGTLHQCFQSIRSPQVLIPLMIFSLFIQGARLMVHYYVTLAMNLQIDISVILYFTPMISIVTALPISVGGIGPKEFVAGALFKWVDISVFDSILKEWLAQGLGILISLPGGLLFLFMKSGLKNEGLRSPVPQTVLSDVESRN
jgi:glycosyltransferase 2 family protein